MEPKNRILVALDVSDVRQAISLVDELAQEVGGFKLGLEFQTSSYTSLVTAEEEEAVENLRLLRELFRKLSGLVFWDAKWNDIPNTIAGAVAAIQPLSPTFFDVHASAGPLALAAALSKKGRSHVLGVTVLTSLDDDTCLSIFGDKPGPTVVKFAKMLINSGADGIVCSPQELLLLKERGLLEHLSAVIPGIRPQWAALGDQKRVMTPREAIIAGASYLVIGRPITKPPKEIGAPRDAARKIVEELSK
jgi:orotidine-5'-phosphate decarboxylase